VEAKDRASTSKKGLYRITMGTKFEPNLSIKKSKYLNKMDESYDIFWLSISPDALFHVDTCKTPIDVWTKLKDFLGKKDRSLGGE
jgi:hypothetical protein